MTYDVTVILRCMLFHKFRKAWHSFGWDTVLIKSDLMDLLNRKIADRSRDSYSVISSTDLIELYFKCQVRSVQYISFTSASLEWKCPIAIKSALIRVKIGTEEAKSHYLNQWWPSWLRQLCVTRPPGYHIEAETDWTPFSRQQLQMHFLNEHVYISITISLKFISKGPINTISALAQIMAWRRRGDKPLYEPMIVRLLMHIHICITRPQWVVHSNW